MQIVKRLRPGQPLFGWRHASLQEVLELWAHAGLQSESLLSGRGVAAGTGALRVRLAVLAPNSELPKFPYPGSCCQRQLLQVHSTGDSESD